MQFLEPLIKHGQKSAYLGHLVAQGGCKTINMSELMRLIEWIQERMWHAPDRVFWKALLH